MLYFPQTRIEFSVERPVTAGIAIPAEGCALVNDLTGGAYGVKPSTGSASEVLAGISINQQTNLLSAPKIEELVVAAGKVTLGKDPVSGTLFVLDGSTVITAGAAATGTYQLSGREISVDASRNGHTLRVAYRYSPTIAEQMALQGNVLPGGPAGAYLGMVGVVSRGDVFTDWFDTTGNWTTAVGVTLGANGMFVPEETAADCIRGVQILELPSAARAFLGLNINASV